MTRDRERWTPPVPLMARSTRTETTSVLRERVGHHLSTLEQVIGSVRGELAEAREQMRRATDERDQLRQELARAEFLQTDRSEAQARWRAGREQDDREAQLRQALEREVRTLRQRCADLEQAVASERDARGALESELACLHDQTRELTEIVGLLMGEDDTL